MNIHWHCWHIRHIHTICEYDGLAKKTKAKCQPIKRYRVWSFHLRHFCYYFSINLLRISLIIIILFSSRVQSIINRLYEQNHKKKRNETRRKTGNNLTNPTLFHTNQNVKYELWSPFMSNWYRRKGWKKIQVNPWDKIVSARYETSLPLFLWERLIALQESIGA